MKNESKLTWKDVVKEALFEIGSSGHLDDIYSKIKGASEDRDQSNMERYRKAHLAAVQHFLPSGEGKRDMVSQGRKNT